MHSQLVTNLSMQSLHIAYHTRVGERGSGSEDSSIRTVPIVALLLSVSSFLHDAIPIWLRPFPPPSSPSTLHRLS